MNECYGVLSLFLTLHGKDDKLGIFPTMAAWPLRSVEVTTEYRIARLLQF